ncbi:MAG: hypothetical protein AAF243_04210 [Cyanobacteria bacterium P01_A01_bin.137]
MAARSIRKSVSFDESEGDRALLDAIATHQAKHDQSFSDLCKQALQQYLLAQEPTQSVLLFMELQHQIAQLNVRVATLENGTNNTATASQQNHQIDSETNSPTNSQTVAVEPDSETADEAPDSDDPILNRLAPLLMDDF